MKYINSYKLFESTSDELKITRCSKTKPESYKVSIPGLVRLYFVEIDKGKINSPKTRHPRAVNRCSYEVCSKDGYTYFFSKDESEGAVFIYGVKAKVKGKGYGTILMKKTIEYLKSLGKKRIILHVDIENEVAIRLYLNMGFIKKVYTDDEEWTGVMWLDLD